MLNMLIPDLHTLPVYEVRVNIYGEEITIHTTNSLDEARHYREMAGKNNRPILWSPTLDAWVF